MKRFSFLIFLFLWICCSSDDPIVNDETSEIEIDQLFIGGNVKDPSTGLNSAVFWHNDELVKFPHTLDESWLNDLVVHNGDIYAIGTIKGENEQHGVLWVNNELIYLHSNEPDSRLNDVFVNDSGWFVAGTEFQKDQDESLLVPTIWTSGGKITLPTESKFAEVSEIIEVKDELYFLGTNLNAFEVVGGDFVYWQMDGKQFVINEQEGNFFNCCGYMKNDQIDMFGSGVVDGIPKLASISSNGLDLFDIPDNGTALVNDLEILNDKVLVVGTLPSFFSDHDNDRGFVFSENKFTFLSDEPSGCNSVMLNNGLILYGGWSNDKNQQKATLWIYKNGLLGFRERKFLWDNGSIVSIDF